MLVLALCLVVFFVCESNILNGFVRKTHGIRVWSLAQTSLNMKVKGQRSLIHHPRQWRSWTCSLQITSFSSKRDHSIAAGGWFRRLAYGLRLVKHLIQPPGCHNPINVMLCYVISSCSLSQLLSECRWHWRLETVCDVCQVSHYACSWAAVRCSDAQQPQDAHFHHRELRQQVWFQVQHQWHAYKHRRGPRRCGCCSQGRQEKVKHDWQNSPT